MFKTKTVVCINCNSDSKKLSYNIPASKRRKGKVHNIALPEALSSVFKISSGSNDSKVIQVLCCDCVAPFEKIYYSKLSFLNLTKRHSAIGLITTNCKSEPTEYLGNNFKSEEIRYNAQTENKSPYRIKSVIKGESILPDLENEDYILGGSLSSFPDLTAIKIIDLEEMHPRIQIHKLTDDQVERLTKSSKGRLKTTFSTKSNRNKPKSNCKICSRLFSSPESAQAHFELVHQQIETPFSCSFCPRKFSLEWFYKIHLEKFHCGVEIQYSCNICRNMYLSSEQLELHKLRDHDIRLHPLNCNHCPDSFNAITHLREHLINKHENSLEAKAALSNMEQLGQSKNMKRRRCTKCEEAFSSIIELYQHMKSEHEVIELKCFFCEDAFESISKVVKHEKEHKTCAQCNLTCKNSKRLMVHIQISHENKKAFKCEICGKVFGRDLTITRHYRWHSNLGSPFHFCNICSRSYPLESQLKQHMKNCHTRKKEKIPCEECDKIFTHKFELNRHLESVHKKVSPFSCDVCDKKFMWKDSLIRHKWFHAKQTFCDTKNIVIVNPNNKHHFKGRGGPIGEKGKIESTSCFSSESYLFTCPVCKKTEEWKSHFIRHLRTHNLTGYTDITAENNLPRNLKCTEAECVKYFCRRDNLIKHIKVYHAEDSKQYTPRFFTCTICKAQMDTMKMYAHRERHDIRIKEPFKSEASVTKKRVDLNSYYKDEERKFTCPVCQLSFPIENQLSFVEHLKTNHLFEIVMSLSSKSQNRCSECHKSFDSSLKVEKHFLQTHCVKNYIDKSSVKKIKIEPCT